LTKLPLAAKELQDHATPPDMNPTRSDATTADAVPEIPGTEAVGPRQDVSTEQNLVEHMARFEVNPYEWFREVALFVSGSGWRAYENVTGQPVFYSGYTDKIKSAVTASPILQRKLTELTEKRLEVEEQEQLLDRTSTTFQMDRAKRKEEIISSLREVTNTMIDNMVCKMESKYFIRSAYYMVTQLLTRAYHQGIYVDREEIDGLRTFAKMAAKQKRSIIFLPCHKSHLDYVSLQLICYRLGFTLPVVVAGDNLNFPLVGSFLQHAGAMWIRRSFDKDPLYITLVQTYIDTLLQNGYNFECFIEGTRSRTGKLLGPRFGILSFLLDSVISGRTEDAYICPVSSQYDKVIEVDSYVSELLGQPKKKENLSDFLSASSVLTLKLGRVDVRFHEPWSLKDFIKSQETRPSHAPNNGSAQASREVRSRMLRTLGYKVLSDINAVSVVMPTALVGTVLLTLRGRGVGRSELIRRVDWLCDRIRAKGGKVAHFHGAPTGYVVDRALEVLGPSLVGSVEGLAEQTFYAVDRFQMSFYRNMTIHLFISEALIAAAMYTKVKQGGGPAFQRMVEPELADQVTFLSQLFRGEFIFPAGEGLAANLEKAVAGLRADEVIHLFTGEDGQTYAGLSNIERQRGRENYDFYCFLIWPFIEAAWLCAVSLMCLTPPSKAEADIWIDMKKAQDSAQLLGKTLYHQGDLSYFEAVNKEALKNAYSRFAEEGIIIFATSKDSKAGPAMRLSPEWKPERDPQTGALLLRGRLWDFIEKIAQCRREGKNRRDGATVSTRVMSMANKLGIVLFEEAKAVKMATTESLVETKKVERRSKL
jgi:glycerol-3-phosphate O-acyltransferase